MDLANRGPWYDTLFELIQSGADDETVLNFVSDVVPSEGQIIDYKTDVYVSADSTHHNKRRRSEFLKNCSAFSNVLHPAEYRYLMIGFDNDGLFEGVQYQDPKGGDHLLDVDDAQIRDIPDNSLYPTPEFDLYEYYSNGERGGILAIKKADRPPVIAEETIRKQDGSAFITQGQAYTRDGSRTVVMNHDAHRKLIEHHNQDLEETLLRELDQIKPTTPDPPQGSVNELRPFLELIELNLSEDPCEICLSNHGNGFATHLSLVLKTHLLQKTKLKSGAGYTLMHRSVDGTEGRHDTTIPPNTEAETFRGTPPISFGFGEVQQTMTVENATEKLHEYGINRVNFQLALVYANQLGEVGSLKLTPPRTVDIQNGMNFQEYFDDSFLLGGYEETIFPEFGLRDIIFTRDVDEIREPDFM